MDLLSKLNLYLDTKKNSWAPTTIRSTRATLNQILGVIPAGPQALVDHYSNHKKYSLLINFNRVIAFIDFLTPGTNEFREFLVKNRRLFKNAYTSERLNVTYSQAEATLLALPADSFRDWALFVLRNGLRYSESLTQDNQGMVLGKGEKSREILFPLSFDADKWTGHHSTFWRRLKKLGLKPHTLRKLAATRALEKGATLPDICQLFGWTNMQTAARYLQPNKMNELRGLLR